MRFCSTCGASVKKPFQRFCGNCGSQMNGAIGTMQSQKADSMSGDSKEAHHFCAQVDICKQSAKNKVILRIICLGFALLAIFLVFSLRI